MKEIKILDKGFIRLVDYMGTDTSITETARVSYAKGTKHVSEDAALIDHLLRNNHGSPFESVVFKFHIKCPIFVARHIFKHRLGSFNEISGRFSIMETEAYVPELSVLKPQSTTNKQGRGEEGFNDEKTHEILARLIAGQEAAFDEYNELLALGLTRELARMNLPLSLYTEFFFTGNLRFFFNFLNLRMDDHAQYETRVYADAMHELIKPIVPATLNSFDNWVRGAVTLSRDEFAALQKILLGEDHELEGKERVRFEKKLQDGKQR